MQLHGKQILGGQATASGTKTFTATNPATNAPLEPAFFEATLAEVDQALELAAQASAVLRHATADKRAELLEAIADAVLELGQPLVDRAHAETGLPMARLEGERTRAVNQARLFAQIVREGSWVDARIDLPLPDRQPLPKPDVRSMSIGIGPVVTFGASNFPLAISVIGTDTITALGAGCPVVVKGHPAHAGTCEMLGEAIARAVAKCGLPAGVFAMLQGASHEVGLALVRHDKTEAVAFTGSLRGGRALFDAAAARPRPIPVYAEMGSTNPVFMLPGALAERGPQIAEGYIGSVTMGVGQFCTNPGLVLGLRNSALGKFVESAATSAASAAPATMLHAGIQQSYKSGVERIAETSGVRLAGRSAQEAADDRTEAACMIFTTDAATLESNPHLTEEVFGPTSIVVECDSRNEMLRIAAGLEGHLTATIHGTEQDLLDYRDLVELLEAKVGRLVFNGFPTGIEVCHAMHHGGPYPATTDAHFTSIGTRAIFRFVRPICYQNFPDAALPEELRNQNSRGIWRMIDGQMTRDNCPTA